MTRSPIDDIAHLDELAGTLRRRQRVLELQIAHYGEAAAPVHLLTDLEETIRQLEATQERLQNLRLHSDSGRTPYLGLQTFDEANADLFFGRAALVAELVERARRTPLLVVLGASGSGKSSVVRAGLIPLLKGGVLPGSETWRYSIIKPGDRPLDTLAAELTKLQGADLTAALDLSRRLAETERALLLTADLLLDRVRGQRLVLVVDQCEELWTLAPVASDQRNSWLAQQQRPFIQLMLAAVASTDSPLLIVLTMRADFLHRAAEHPALARAISDHDLIISPMESEDLRAAIVEPARLRGVSFEPGLIDELIEQVQGQSGTLPLLEYTLLELWKRRTNTMLTWEAYHQLGGVEGSLAARADQIITEHYKSEQHDVLRQILLRLVQPGAGAVDTRRRALLANLIAEDSSVEIVQGLIKPLVDARLLTTGLDILSGAETVEISHEALIRAWPTLGRWIEQARGDVQMQIEIEEAAKDWYEQNKHSEFLWTGLRLANAEAWVARAHPQLTEREHTFLQVSHYAQRRATLIRRGTVSALVVLLLAVLAAIALWQTQVAEEQVHGNATAQTLASTAQILAYAQATAAADADAQVRIAETAQADAVRQAALAQTEQRRAETQARVSTSRELAAAANANFEDNPSLSLLLAMEAVSTTYNLDSSIVPEAEEVLYKVTNKQPALLTMNKSLEDPWGYTNDFNTVAYSPDGSIIASAMEDGQVIIWNAHTAEMLATIHVSDRNAVRSVAFRPDGLQIAAGSTDNNVYLISTTTKSIEHVLEGHTNYVVGTAYSPDGKGLVTASWDGTIRVWDTTTLNVVKTLTGHQAIVESAKFSPDARKIVSASRDGTARIWDAQTGDELAVLNPGAVVGDAVFDPEGLQVATITWNGKVSIWDVESQHLVREWQAHSESGLSVEYSPDGSAILTASGEGVISIWSAIDGRLLRSIRAHTEDVRDAIYSPDGKYILSSSYDGTAKVWLASLDSLLGEARLMAQGRAFSCEERQRYLHEIVFCPTPIQDLSPTPFQTAIQAVPTPLDGATTTPRHQPQETTSTPQSAVITTPGQQTGSRILYLSDCDPRVDPQYCQESSSLQIFDQFYSVIKDLDATITYDLTTSETRLAEYDVIIVNFCGKAGNETIISALRKNILSGGSLVVMADNFCQGVGPIDGKWVSSAEAANYLTSEFGITFTMDDDTSLTLSDSITEHPLTDNVKTIYDRRHAYLKISPPNQQIVGMKGRTYIALHDGLGTLVAIPSVGFHWGNPSEEAMNDNFIFWRNMLSWLTLQSQSKRK